MFSDETPKPRKVLVLQIVILLNGVLLFLAASFPDSSPETDPRNLPDSVTSFDANAHLEHWTKKIKERLSAEKVPSGTSKLCVALPTDSEKSIHHSTVSIFLDHLAQNKIPMSVQKRDGQDVRVYENLKAEYAKEWLPLFETAKLRAWVE